MHGVVDARLQLRVGIVSRRRRSSPALLCARRSFAVPPPWSVRLEAVVEAHVYAAFALARLGRRRKLLRLVSSVGNTPFAITSSASAKSEPGSASTAAAPRLTVERDGAIRGDLVAHLLLEGGFDLALLHPHLRVRAVENDPDPLLAGTRASRACRARGGRSSASARRGEQTSSSSSVRSSVASIGPWKNGDVSTTITS